MTCRTILFAVVMIAALMPCADAGKRYAVIVGVKKYRPGQPLPELSFTENDATKLAEILKTGGYQVTLMTQAVGRIEGREVMNPLSDYIRDQIDAVVKNPFLKDDDIVIVALAGHGVQYEHSVNGRKSPHFYFCPADANIRGLQTTKDISERSRLIDLSELYDGLKDCKAGGKLLLVDACRNDPSKPAITRSLASATLPPLPPPSGGTAAFFSCSAHQKAFEDADLKHGVFFHHVIEALQGRADAATADRPADGQITLAELSQHVSIETYDFVRNKYQGAKQAPELKGEFRLSVPLIELKQELITNSIGMKLNLIPAGEFMMGSPKSEQSRHDDEGPQHKVRISTEFYMGQTEVTQGQWFKVMNQKPWQGAELLKEGDRYPASFVSWNAAVDFCRRLSEQESRTYRLPTEAEWEYACRAGATTAYGFGSSVAQLSGYAWWGGIGGGNAMFEKYAHIVRTREANAFGLYDMHGNLYEWCSDQYDSKYYGNSPLVDPPGGSGTSRVLRGGSWAGGAGYARCSYRHSLKPDSGGGNVGFRVVLE